MDENNYTMEATMNMTNQGKYGDEAKILLERTSALAALAIVIGGDRGTGWAIRLKLPELLPRVPELLRSLANEIENGGKKDERTN